VFPSTFTSDQERSVSASDSGSRPPRREFIGQLATVAAALAATACVSGGGTLAAGAVPAPAGALPKLPDVAPLAPIEFDDAWTSRLSGKYRAVFDSPDIEDGTAVFNAYAYMKGFKDMYKLADTDVNAVVVIRHRAIPMALDDEMWSRYKLGEYAKITEFGSEKWATRNPFLNALPGDEEDAEYAISALTKRGVVFLACAMATQGMASILAKRSGDKSAAMFDELRRHLIPGLALQPSGIFAVMRAQAAGCHYMRST
jgi:intracellular sulfur oxidation DsrE/DsrF family protein